MAGSSVGCRPNPKRRLIGLIGGTGGGCSIPFFNDAPAGRLIVSITEVVERKMGSEMSAFAMDFFRSVPVLGIIAPAPALNEGSTGVEVPETGGVFAAEYGGTGDA